MTFEQAILIIDTLRSCQDSIMLGCGLVASLIFAATWKG